jgi:hypothetical protein
MAKSAARDCALVTREHLLQFAQPSRLTHNDETVPGRDLLIRHGIEQHGSIGLAHGQHDQPQRALHFHFSQRLIREGAPRADAHLLNADVRPHAIGGEIHELLHVRLNQGLRHAMTRTLIRSEDEIRARAAHFLLRGFLVDTRRKV